MKKGYMQCIAALGKGNCMLRRDYLISKVELAEEVKFEGVVTTVC